MKKNILVITAFISEIEENDEEKQILEIDDLIDKFGKKDRLTWIQTRKIFLNKKSLNCGQCDICKNWVTNIEKNDPIPYLPNGVIYKGKLLCDEHLPKNHKWAFN